LADLSKYLDKERTTVESEKTAAAVEYNMILKEESIIEDASCPINLFLNLIQVINVSAR
jgi:hypothetical protein